MSRPMHSRRAQAIEADEGAAPIGEGGLAESRQGSAREVLGAFLRLGCLSFGGPVAHLGYFHTEFVERRRWCDEETFGEIVALAQALPGPASSQVGFVLGLLRAGGAGAAAAWLGFTMPSALLMLAFAFGHRLLSGRLGAGAVHGLQLVAVAVVAQAIISMRRTLAPDWARMALAAVAALIVFFNLGTLLAIATGVVVGLALPPGRQPTSADRGRIWGTAMPAIPRLAAQNQRVEPFGKLRASSGAPAGVGFLPSVVATVVFILLLFGLPVAAVLAAHYRQEHFLLWEGLAVANAFYRTGALVFGGGHVVLPLLERAVVQPGWVDPSTFLAGYGAAQAIPGPLFTFSAFLGAVVRPAVAPVLISAVALVTIFLPGLLLIVAVLPHWSRLRERPRVQAALRGVNAAVVGVLAAAFVHPVWTSAVHSIRDVAIALAAFVALVRWRVAPWIVVAAVAGVSTLTALV
jgi:chromate transporter